MRWVQEFKTFIQRGNVIDLAVAVIIGAAFGKIVTSLVDNVFTPPLALLTQQVHDLIFEVGRYRKSRAATSGRIPAIGR